MRSFFMVTLSLGALLALGCGDDGDPPGTDAGPGNVDAGPAGADAGPGGTDAGPGEASCAPETNLGTAAGRNFRDFTLTQCTTGDDYGTDFQFYSPEYCADESIRVTVLSIAAGWCGPCILESQQLEAEINDVYGPMGVRVIQAIVQTEDYDAADLAYCSNWVSTYGLSNIEIISPANELGIYFPDGVLPSTIIVLRDGTIHLRENGASRGLLGLKAAIDEALELSGPAP